MMLLRKTFLFLMAFCFSLCLSSESLILAQDDSGAQRETSQIRETRESASVENEIQQELQMMAAQLHALETHRIKIRERAESLDPDERIQVLRLEIEDLGIEKEMVVVRDRIVDLEQRLVDQEKANDSEGDSNGPDNVIRKIEHIRIASRHLKEAGLNDLASQLQRHSQEMERELHRKLESHNEEASSYRDVSDREFRDEVIGAIRELNGAVRELREEIRQTKEMIDRD